MNLWTMELQRGPVSNQKGAHLPDSDSMIRLWANDSDLLGSCKKSSLQDPAMAWPGFRLDGCRLRVGRWSSCGARGGLIWSDPSGQIWYDHGCWDDGGR
jgi:hypothetical protein